MDFLPKKLEKYIDSHSEAEEDLLSNLSRQTHLKVLLPQMLSGHPQGLFLKLISKMINPGKILEIGTYTGYSAICLAKGLKKNGVLHTIDINEELYDMSNTFFKKAGVHNIVKQHIGDAKLIIPKIKGAFDLVFIDADKKSYSDYFDLIIDRVQPGGFILVDNVLWSGRGLNNKKDKDTSAIDEFNKKVKEDKRVETLILPIRDGISIIRVI